MIANIRLYSAIKRFSAEPAIVVQYDGPVVSQIASVDVVLF